MKRRGGGDREPCGDFKAGKCTRGDRCRYEHVGQYDDGPPAKRRGDQGDRGGHDNEGGGHRGMNGGLGALRKHVFKVLCSDPLAANIIGSGGASRSALEEDTGSSLWMSKREEFYPGSMCRICIIHGDDDRSVMAAMEQIVPKLVEVAERDRERGTEVETPLVGKEDGEYIFRTALPSFIRGKLIGTKGANIQELREKTGAKIFVDNDICDGHQFTRIIGPPDIILNTLRRLNDMVQEEANTGDFSTWASVQKFHGGSEGGKGGHREPRRDHSPPPRARQHSPPRGGGRGEQHGGRGRGDAERFDLDRRGGRYGEPHAQGEQLVGLANGFPGGAMEMDHCIRCDLPNNRVGALIGKRGQNVNDVERQTGAKVAFEESGQRDEDVEFRTISITGPLLSCYYAHMMLMKTYHDKEVEESTKDRRRDSGGGGKGGGDKMELQDQIAQLENQLRDMRGRGGGDGGNDGRRR